VERHYHDELRQDCDHLNSPEYQTKDRSAVGLRTTSRPAVRLLFNQDRPLKGVIEDLPPKPEVAIHFTLVSVSSSTGEPSGVIIKEPHKEFLASSLVCYGVVSDAYPRYLVR
jgi:hypothetical protein